MSETPAPPSAWLVPLAGPTLKPLELKAAPNGQVIGRHDQCDVCLPADAESVSRYHARFTYDSGQWRINDLNSRWGTFVNGVKISTSTDVPLSEGDLVRINPWTFSFSKTRDRQTGVDSRDDARQMHTVVREVTSENARPLADEMLALLLESAAGIHAAEDEKKLADGLLDAAISGTGLTNAALLRPLDAAGRIEVIATRGNSTGGAIYSRSLLATASRGVVAELANASANPEAAESIRQMNINTALCVPLMLGTTVAAYLYLDSRGSARSYGHALRPGASAFCVALGRMAGLALSNLKRIDIERRQAVIEAELKAGAEAQKWILPRREGKFGIFAYTGESRPGRYIGGDFFDVIPLGEDKLAIALGDVAGKGIGASVLMTASQGFLHASLKRHGDPAQAITELNQFIMPRRPDGKFVTLWLGVFDPKSRELTFVDAGHGHAIMIDSNCKTEFLGRTGTLPVGVIDDETYTAQRVPLTNGSRALIVSDGIVEQFGEIKDAEGKLVRKQFEVHGIVTAMKNCKPGEDEIEKLFSAVIAHAGTTTLADDATAVLLKWE